MPTQKIGQSSGFQDQNQKLVIAICRRPVQSFEDEDPDLAEDDGSIEYDRNNMNQYYHVEEVLAMVDIANEGEVSSGQIGMENMQMQM